MLPGDIIRNSTLHMSDVPLPGDGLTTDWGSLLTNRIMVVAAILVILLNLPNFFNIGRTVIECMRIARANSTLEHSYNQASMRNQTAWAQILPLALIADRFRLIHPDYFDKVPELWHAPMTLGILLAFLFVRLVISILLKPRRLNSEVTDTVHRILFTMGIALSTAALCTVGTMLVFKASDEAVRSVLLWESGIFFFLTILREGQILGSHCSGFSTFLYLCALEMVPAAVLVAATAIY